MVFEINGVDVSKLVNLAYSLEMRQSGESTIDLAGNKHVDAITEKVVLECQCGRLSMAEASTLLQSFDIKVPFGSECDVNYPDPKVGANSVKQFEVTDRTASRIIEIDGVQHCVGISFKLQEL